MVFALFPQAMTDPSLSSLCSICHICPHKYRCPRCLILTCSLPCCLRHKQWTPCNGVRDPATYLKASALATPKGIDHDYNYLTSLERALDDADKDATIRGIILDRPADDRSATGAPWSDAERRLRGRRVGPKKGEIPLQQALERCAVIVSHAPEGMARARSNNTHWLPKRKCIMWTVEWVLPGGRKQLGECMDDQPLREAFTDLIRRKEMTGRAKKRIQKMEKKQTEDKKELEMGKALDHLPGKSSTLEHTSPQILPDQKTTQLEEQDVTFYLHAPSIPTKNTVLVPLSSEDDLVHILRHRLVLEYPTVYVFALDPDANNVDISGEDGEITEKILPPGFITEEAYYHISKGQQQWGGPFPIEEVS